ncbi:hypothetical protein CKAN_02707400 [Cinnamomum micranthum f. kanehirae]|uniref:Uncharacterized protein n=1 Tax=Cinnamomum micranthum f. kanehirae TaxID=337451 RepID=A0A3S3PTY9_9MAGN|nr:hypothetical protein CKAN_02707400 [Cinnamomum micranthum f. kanehirae]
MNGIGHPKGHQSLDTFLVLGPETTVPGSVRKMAVDVPGRGPSNSLYDKSTDDKLSMPSKEDGIEPESML